MVVEEEIPKMFGENQSGMMMNFNDLEIKFTTDETIYFKCQSLIKLDKEID